MPRMKFLALLSTSLSFLVTAANSGATPFPTCDNSALKALTLCRPIVPQHLPIQPFSSHDTIPLSELSWVGNKKAGRNHGGLYADKKGTRYHVKSASQGHATYVASKILRALYPEGSAEDFLVFAPGYRGQDWIASKELKGFKSFVEVDSHKIEGTYSETARLKFCVADNFITVSDPHEGNRGVVYGSDGFLYPAAVDYDLAFSHIPNVYHTLCGIEDVEGLLVMYKSLLTPAFLKEALVTIANLQSPVRVEQVSPIWWSLLVNVNDIGHVFGLGSFFTPQEAQDVQNIFHQFGFQDTSDLSRPSSHVAQHWNDLVRYGKWERVKALLPQKELFNALDLLQVMTERGLDKEFAQLVAQGHTSSEDLLKVAVENGRDNMLRLFLERGDTSTTDLLEAAVSGRGNAEVIRLLLEHGYKSKWDILRQAIEHRKDVGVIRLLLNHDYKSDADVLRLAVEQSQDLAVVNLLLEQGYKSNKDLLKIAVERVLQKKVSPEIIHMLAKHGYKSEEDLLATAVGWGTGRETVEVVEALLEVGYTSSKDLLEVTVKRDFAWHSRDENILKMAALLLKKDFKSSEDLLNIAMSNKHLGMVPLLLKHGYKSSENLLDKVISQTSMRIDGQDIDRTVEAAKVLMEAGYTSSEDLLLQAINKGCAPLVESLLGYYPLSLMHFERSLSLGEEQIFSLLKACVAAEAWQMRARIGWMELKYTLSKKATEWKDCFYGKVRTFLR